jgi:membrane-anchored glycerophosphoryl diester phosphodiesterase (GDPDase)
MSHPILVIVPLAVTLVLVLVLVLVALKTDVYRVIVLPQDPVYSVQDAVHKAIVLGDVNRGNSIATAGL